MIHNDIPETVMIDQSGANLAALKAINAECESHIRIRQWKYLNNIVEQDHRAIKRRIRPMLGFKKFNCDRVILIGIELMHMINKEHLKIYKLGRTPAQQFYSLAALLTLTTSAFICTLFLSRQNPKEPLHSLQSTASLNKVEA